jgi:hypothetical protein
MNLQTLDADIYSNPVESQKVRKYEGPFHKPLR